MLDRSLRCNRDSPTVRFFNRECLNLGSAGPSDDNDARALFLTTRLEERAELLWIVSHRFEFCHQRKDIREVSQPLT